MSQGTTLLFLCVKHGLIKSLLIATLQFCRALLQLMLQLLQSLALEIGLLGSVFGSKGCGGKLSLCSGNPV